MVSRDRIAEILYSGVWALFLFILAAVALLIVAKSGKLPFLVENFHADSYDTIYSVKAMSEYGLFGDVPVYSQPYHLFGNFPILFAMLASVINLFVDDVSLSTTLLYWAVELGIIAILWGDMLKKCDWRVRVAFVALFLFNIAFGNLFPLGFRKRQQLAVLLGLAMFYFENRYLQAALSFAALLAQPFTGAALVFLKGADSLQKKDWAALALLGISSMAALPFYLGLASSLFQEPPLAGCGSLTYQDFAGFSLLLSLAFLSFYITNRSSKDLLFYSTVSLALFFPVTLALYALIKDFFSFQMLYIRLASLPCNETLLQVAAIGAVVLVGLRGFRISRVTVSLFLIVVIISMSSLAAHLIIESSVEPVYVGMFSILDAHNMSNVKTLHLVMTNYSGNAQTIPTFPFFPMLSYALLSGRNTTFVDEFNLPPQLSKGGSNIPMSRIPLAIYESDTGACRDASRELKASGVQALLYLVTYDFTTSPDRGRFVNETTLDACGLGVVSANTQSNGASVLIYEVK